VHERYRQTTDGQRSLKMASLLGGKETLKDMLGRVVKAYERNVAEKPTE